MKIENEVKFKISPPSKSLINKIIGLGFKFQKETSQEDYYFSPPHKNFAGTKKYYLRLRKKVGGTTILAYHIVVNNFQTKELEVGCDSFVNLKSLLQQLDFKIDCVVKKSRQTFIDKKNNFELVLDKVVGLGYFMEIEYVGKMNKIKKAKFKDIISGLGLLNNQIVSGCGYPDLLVDKNKK